MKLSEAIRLGATISKQICGQLMDSEGNTCAIGSALVACGAKEMMARRAYVLFPLLAQRVPIPNVITGRYADVRNLNADVYSIITHLNDVFGWTREQIADWVETVEAQHPEFNAAPAEAVKEPVSEPQTVAA